MKPLLLLLLFAPAAIGQPGKKDSLVNVLARTGADTNRVRALNDLANLYWSSNPQQVKTHAEEALHLARTLNYPNGIAQSHISLGIYHWALGQTREAIQYHEKALELFRQTGNQKGIAAAYSSLGLNYKDQGDYTRGFAAYVNALRIHEKSGDRLAQSQILNNIGVLFKYQDKYDQALPYFQRAADLVRTLDLRQYAGGLSNIGSIYQLKKKHRNAIRYLLEALAIFEKVNEPRGIAVCHNNLGDTYAEMTQYALAESHYRKAIALAEPLNNTRSVLAGFIGLGNVRTKTGQPADGVGFYEKAHALAEKLSLKKERTSVYEGLTAAYVRKGDFENALRYQTKLIALRDSVFGQESSQKIAHIQAEYESDKQQAKIEILTRDKRAAQGVQGAIGAGLLATLLIAGLVLSRQRLKIRKNRLVLEQSQLVAVKNQQLEAQTHLLEAQAGKLQELDEAKSRFFANLSHEFRTPLTLILGTLSDKLQGFRLRADAPEMPIRHTEVTVMHRNAQRLLQLINQLLDLSKIESGKLELHRRDADLRPLLRLVAASFSSLAVHRGISFEVPLDAQPLTCRFDPDQFEKVVTNLLSNAFKFTPDGGAITLQAEVIENRLVQLAVEDSGMGIPTDQVDTVFERFFQGNQPFVSDQQGTGIGLALTKELVLLHGGTIRAESRPGSGARFVLQLPFVETSDEETTETPVEWRLPLVAESVHPTATPSPDAARPLLLLVEDNADLREYIRGHLEAEYRILQSENGLQGWETALSELPDLIVSDWMMPDMDGIELCRRVKSDERTNHIPFVLLTALATSEGKLTGLETGADEYLTKPFDSRELDLRIRNLIESRRNLRERFGRELRIQPSDVTATPADEKFLRRVMAIVENHLDDSEFSAEQFGREVGLSRMQLHRKLIALTGQSSGDFIRVMRLKRAAQLFEARAATVSEVAYAVGFNSLSYFSKCFREQFGVLPTEYARRPATQEGMV